MTRVSHFFGKSVIKSGFNGVVHISFCSLVIPVALPLSLFLSTSPLCSSRRTSPWHSCGTLYIRDSLENKDMVLLFHSGLWLITIHNSRNWSRVEGNSRIETEIVLGTRIVGSYYLLSRRSVWYYVGRYSLLSTNPNYTPIFLNHMPTLAYDKKHTPILAYV